MKTRFLTLALILLSAVGAWAYDFEVDGLYYGFSYDSSNEVYVTYGDTQPSGEITIPSSVSYNGQIYSVTSIGGSAFEDCSALTSVTIPNSVTNIDAFAFLDCSALTNVYYNGSVADWCQIDFSYMMSSNPLSNGANFYINNQLVTDLVIPDEVTTIKDFAFSGYTSLTSVTIPNSVTSIGGSAFEECSALTSVTIPNSVTSIGNRAFRGCSALTSVTIPNSVTSIGSYAFYGCSALTSVTIPNSVTSIGYGAFYGCSALTSVTIPNSVTSIGDRAFKECSALSYICSEAATPPTLDGAPFSFTNFQVVFVPAGTATAYANAWGNNYTYIDSETEVTVHVETVGQLTAAIVEQGATPAQVTKLTVTGTLNEADFNIIKNNMPLLYSLDLSGISNTTLPNAAFSQKQTLLSIAIPNGLTGIPNRTFEDCSGLASVTIPNSVTSIGHDAFYGCSALTSVTIPNSVTSIGNRAFESCSALTSVTIPNSVTSIGYGAFEECSALTSVTIPNSVTSIGSYAFESCSALTSVTIPNSVTSIGEKAFRYCFALTSVTIPNSVTSIGEQAFKSCFALTSVTIGNKVQNIYSNTFSSCYQLDTITCLGSVPPTVDSNFETIDPNTCKLYVPNNALMDYASAPVWSAFLNMEGIDVNYQLTLQINEGGKVSCNNHDYTDTTELTFAAGTEVSLKLIPDAGYRVSSVFVNGEYYTDQITEDLTFILTLKSDATISVSFKSEEYVITFVNDDGTVLQSEQLEYGEMPIYNGAVPTKEATAEYEYEFIGWSPEITIVTGDARYTATYKEVQLSAYNTATSSRLRAWQADGTLFVEVDDAVEAVMVYDVTGRLMQEYQHNGGYQMLNLPAPNKVMAA